MTVWELVRALADLDPTSEVQIRGEEGDWMTNFIVYQSSTFGDVARIEAT